jgi:hypothetical protein
MLESKKKYQLIVMMVNGNLNMNNGQSVGWLTLNSDFKKK